MSTLSRHQAERQSALVNLRSEFALLERVDEQRLAAESNVRSRITGVAAEPERDVVAELRVALAGIEQSQAGERWVPTGRSIGDLMQALAAALESATRRRDAAQALLSQREELRGRLSAYRAMAIRLRHAEDLELAAAYERTYQLLWNSPCDLDAAAAAVADYQRAVIERTETTQSRGTQE
jgi:hypothetical protein